MKKLFKNFERGDLIPLSCIVIIISIGLIAACTPDKSYEQKQAEEKTYLISQVEYHTLNNGLECAFISGSNQMGLSCNWEKYNKENAQ